MQGDLLLQEWKQAKEICSKIIEICKKTHLGRGKVEGRVMAPGEKQTGKQFINVYDVVYRLCVTKEKEENRVLMVYRDYKEILKTALLEMCPLVGEERDIYRLDALRKVWDAYCDIQKRLNNMFAYLNRPFHVRDGKIEELDKTATNIVVGTLFLEPAVVEYELLYFREIDKIRKVGDFSCQKILANMVDIFYRIHLKILKNSSSKKIRTIYTELFGKYQKNAREFYSRRFKVLKELSPSEYFVEVDKMYLLEKQIAENCFVISADSLFSREFAEELVVSYKTILLTSEYGLKFILRQGQVTTLKLIVDLYLRLTRSLDGFKEQFEEYICEEMRGFIQDCRPELTARKSLLNYCNFVEKVIRKNQQLVVVLDALAIVGDFASYYKSGVEKAFSSAKLPIPMEELLAIYTDAKLRVELDEAEFEREVRSIITIFNCLQNKDLFLLKYSQRLAKRILALTESAIHNHEIFTSNLKLNCGIKYTEGLQTIITEYRISADNQRHLDEIQQREKLPISFTLRVFSEGAWPMQNQLELPIEHFPSQMQDAHRCLDIYSAQHLSKKTLKLSGMESKVRWAYYFDSEVKAKYETCYIDTNCLQAALLYKIYRSRPHRLALQTLEQQFPKVSPKLIKECLTKMADSADNILIRSSEGDDTLFNFNLLMRAGKKLIAFDQGGSQQEERILQQHDLGKDREIVLDANISKLMKARKVVDYKSMIEEVTKMIRVFVPASKDIKIAVDRLIAKEILQRDEKDRELIRYRD